jgi:hypothetical protein
MLKTGDSKKWLGTMLMVLAVLMVGITATGYADPTERVSGPALVGTLQLIGNASDVTVQVTFNGHCRGEVAQFPAGTTADLPTTLGSLTAANLQGLPLPGVGVFACPGKKDQPVPSDNLIVKAVMMPSKFMNTGSPVTAEVALLFVLP